VGLRERKKQQTRELIADTARRLFAEHGFERVTVAQIAQEADVAEATVFNYFPTKEDLFYSRLEAFEEELLTAVRERRPGVSVLEAFRDFLLARRGVFAMNAPGGDDAATEQLRTVTRIITALAALIVEETGSAPGDVAPRVVANALLGAHRALIDFVRERALAGARASQISREVRAQAKRAFAQLERGLGDLGE
jgi:AcrR family transcriptional regulator